MWGGGGQLLWVLIFNLLFAIPRKLKLFILACICQDASSCFFYLPHKCAFELSADINKGKQVAQWQQAPPVQLKFLHAQCKQVFKTATKKVNVNMDQSRPNSAVIAVMTLPKHKKWQGI